MHVSNDVVATKNTVVDTSNACWECLLAKERHSRAYQLTRTHGQGLGLCHTCNVESSESSPEAARRLPR